MPGDVILGVNSRAVEDPEGLRFRLATLPVGETAILNVLRKGEKRDLARAAMRSQKIRRQIIDNDGR